MADPITPIDLSQSATKIASDIRNRYSAGGRRRAKPKLRSGIDGFRIDIADDVRDIPVIPINADTGQAIVDFDEVRGSNVIWGIVDRSDGFDVVGVSPSNGNGGWGDIELLEKGKDGFGEGVKRGLALPKDFYDAAFGDGVDVVEEDAHTAGQRARPFFDAGGINPGHFKHALGQGVGSLPFSVAGIGAIRGAGAALSFAKKGTALQKAGTALSSPSGGAAVFGGALSGAFASDEARERLRTAGVGEAEISRRLPLAWALGGGAGAILGGLGGRIYPSVSRGATGILFEPGQEAAEETAELFAGAVAAGDFPTAEEIAISATAGFAGGLGGGASAEVVSAGVGLGAKAAKRLSDKRAERAAKRGTTDAALRVSRASEIAGELSAEAIASGADERAAEELEKAIRGALLSGVKPSSMTDKEAMGYVPGATADVARESLAAAVAAMDRKGEDGVGNFVAGLQSQLGENWSGGVKDVEAAIVKVAPDYGKKGLSAIPASARGLVSGLLDSRRPPSGMESIDERLRSNIDGYEKLSGELRSGESAVAGVKNRATARAAEKKGGGEKKAGRLERLESMMIEIESDWAELAAASDGRYVPPSFRVHPRHAVWRAKKYRRVDEKLGSATDAAREEFGGDEGLAAAGRAFVKARRGGEEALRQFAESVGDTGAKALDSILEATDKARGARAAGRIVKGKKGISTSQGEGGGGSEVKIQPDNTTDSNEAKEFLAEYQRIDKLEDGASDDLAATEYVEDGRDEAIGAVLDSEGRKPERSEWSDLLSAQGYDGAGEDVINRAMAIANFSGSIEETNAAAVKYAAAVLPNFEGREEKEFWSYLKNRGVAFEQTDGAVAEEIGLKVEKRGKKRVIIVSESVAPPVVPAEETVKEEKAEEKSKDEEEPPKTKAGIKRKQAIAFILKPEVASARKAIDSFFA